MGGNTRAVHIDVNGTAVEVLFRPAREEDAKELLALSGTTDRFHISDDTDAPDLDELLFWMNDPRSIVLVAEEISAARGAILAYAYGTCISPKWFAFEGFMVTPRLQRHGLGKAMYSYLRDRCSELGIDLIQGLVIDGDDNSLRYWLERGFEEGKRCVWVEDWLD